MKHISDKTNTKVVLQGKEQGPMHELLAQPLCLFITASTRESLAEAKSLCGHLIKTTEQKYIEFKYDFILHFSLYRPLLFF